MAGESVSWTAESLTRGTPSIDKPKIERKYTIGKYLVFGGETDEQYVERQKQMRRDAKKREYARRKDVILARAKAWRDANPEKASAAAKAWRESNPEKKAASTRRNYEKHRERRLERARVAHANLIDSVVKSYFCDGSGLQSKDVPIELIPAIRLSILIKRELKGKRK